MERKMSSFTTATPTAPAAAAAATVYSSHELAMENVMPGIFLTKNFIAWNEENLRTHGFTHIIIIDKHIQELYYPASPLFKLSPHNNSNSNNHNKYDAYDDNVFEHFSPTTAALSFGKEFTALDLNFGEKSYLTTVLPNCYRAVQFINKALQKANGSILVIDCNGGEQKCVTVVVAYLMYKHNISFSAAFARLKQFYKKADLDRFYSSQLYEYEPILQVQRGQARGQSSSRARQAAILKRKKLEDDETIIGISSIATTTTTAANDIIDIADDATDFFNSFNPLTQFNASSSSSDTTTTTAATHAASMANTNATAITTITNNHHQLQHHNNTMTSAQSFLQQKQTAAAAAAIKATSVELTQQQQSHIQLSTYYKSVHNNNNNNTCDDDYAME